MRPVKGRSRELGEYEVFAFPCLREDGRPDLIKWQLLT